MLGTQMSRAKMTEPMKMSFRWQTLVGPRNLALVGSPGIPHGMGHFPVLRNTYRVGQRRGHRLMTIILSILNRFKKCFDWKIPW